MRTAESLAIRDNQPVRRALLANPRGFCAGVTRAIASVEHAIARFGPPIYVRRPIVHNRAVVARLEDMGAIFVREVEEVPPNAIVILSAHGVAPAVFLAAKARGLRVIDAICPLVAKVHGDVIAHARMGRHIILIGHADHPEIIGTMGQVPADAVSVIANAQELARLDLPPGGKLAYAIQTTFAVRDAQAIVAAIEARFADVAGPRSGNICYATANRQAAVEAIAVEADYILVVGDAMSSNARRLVEVAMSAGCPHVALVSGPSDLDWPSIDRARTIGLTAAASTPDSCVQDICCALAKAGFAVIEYDGLRESVLFNPVALDPA